MAKLFYEHGENSQILNLFCSCRVGTISLFSPSLHCISFSSTGTHTGLSLSVKVHQYVVWTNVKRKVTFHHFVAVVRKRDAGSVGNVGGFIGVGDFNAGAVSAFEELQ